MNRVELNEQNSYDSGCQNNEIISPISNRGLKTCEKKNEMTRLFILFFVQFLYDLHDFRTVFDILGMMNDAFMGEVNLFKSINYFFKCVVCHNYLNIYSF